MTVLLETTSLDLDPQTVESVRRVNATLAELARRRQGEIRAAGPFGQSKLAWKIASYQQALLHRIVMLTEGAFGAWNAGNVLTGFLCARALVETVAVMTDFARRLQVCLENGDLTGANGLVNNRTFATRDNVILARRPETPSVNVLTLIDKLDAGGLSGVRNHYDSMSERCHPNAIGHHQLFAATDYSARIVKFSATKNILRNFHHILGALMLVEFVENLMDELDEHVAQVAVLQHRLNPVA
jgi:hypothetical protein